MPQPLHLVCTSVAEEIVEGCIEPEEEVYHDAMQKVYTIELALAENMHPKLCPFTEMRIKTTDWQPFVVGAHYAIKIPGIYGSGQEDE